MAVTTSVNISTGLYVPYAQQGRGGDRHNLPVASVQMAMTATGDGSGGAVTLQLTATRNDFGYKCLALLIEGSTRDGLSAAESVRLLALPNGNRRLSDTIEFVMPSTAIGGANYTRVPRLNVPMDFDQVAIGAVVQVLWATNTNAVVYIARLLFHVYDAEYIEKYGQLPRLLEGS